MSLWDAVIGVGCTLAVIGGAYWFASNTMTVSDAMCHRNDLIFRAGQACYVSDQCLLTGEDYRQQFIAKDYLEENCPIEWQTIQGAAPSTGPEEADGSNEKRAGNETDRAWPGPFVSAEEKP